MEGFEAYAVVGLLRWPMPGGVPAARLAYRR